MLDCEETVPIESLLGSLQKELSSRVSKRKMDYLREELSSTRESARLNFLSLPHAGDWLNVVPSPALGLQLRGQEFRTSVLYRLGAPVFPGEGACVACGQLSDRVGNHAVGCASQGECISSHNHLRDALFTTAQSAQLAPLKEQAALLPGVSSRPADVLLPNFAGGRHLALDVMVLSSHQAALVDGAARDPGHALQQPHREKWLKYGEACHCQSEGILFQPLCVEVLGGWGEGEAVVRRLGQSLARFGGLEEGQTISHLLKRLSILLMRGNSQLILSRCPSHPDSATSGH